MFCLLVPCFVVKTFRQLIIRTSEQRCAKVSLTLLACLPLEAVALAKDSLCSFLFKEKAGGKRNKLRFKEQGFYPCYKLYIKSRRLWPAALETRKLYSLPLRYLLMIRDAQSLPPRPKARARARQTALNAIKKALVTRSLAMFS